MKLKSILCTTLSAALLCAGAFAAGVSGPQGGESVTSLPLDPAGEAEQPVPPGYDIAQWSVSMPVMVYGTATVEEGRVLLENDNESSAWQRIILNVNEDTVILDAVTGEVKTADDLKTGDTLYAYAGPAMTRSLPPIANAAVVLCNIPADFGVPIYAEVQQVLPGEDGKVSVLMTGDIILHLSEETELLQGPGFTCGNTFLSDIRPGTRLLSWYSMVMESYPSQAVPSKVLVFPSAYAGYTDMSDGGNITVNGEQLGAAAYEANGVLMVPVRALAEALGCEVAWDPDRPDTVSVTRDGQPLYSFQAGGDAATLEGDMVVGLRAASAAKGGVTYLAADDLISFHRIKLVGLWPLS